MALFTVLGLCFTSVHAADPTVSITIQSDEPGHEYKAYQIFTGTVTPPTASGVEPTLSNIAWGSSVTSVSPIQIHSILGLLGITGMDDDLQSAAAAANALSTQFANDSSGLQKFADTILDNGYVQNPVQSTNDYNASTGDYTLSGLTPGYYLISDSPYGDQQNPGNMYSNILLSVTSDTPITPKIGKAPQIVKTVKTSASQLGQYQKGASYSVGTEIPYQITTTLPDDYNSFGKYVLTLNDTLPKGFTYVDGSLSLSYENPDATTATPFAASTYTLSTS